MKTTTKIEIASETQGQFIFLPLDEDYNDGVSFDDATPEQLKIAAKVLGVPPATIEFFNGELTSLRNAVQEDLEEIWKRLDKMEAKINEL